ncbi:triose-phosphate isomerase [Clostridium sp. NSJ-145]|uniref:triose-phosphate isomerase n=1 Tax=Clostridium sp. NSJ-145 TaxID=2897777 RepID=UPI001E55A142|nr:triose-phosphate isomerase family protein [Clostridium sp. NSJ-145]MCD2502038.1 triose-phosphate isomerase [Clostridium sp. NSJ-145]
MREIFVNLKRFDVPKELGGICKVDNPKAWIENIVDKSVELGLGTLEDIIVVYMLPESYIIPAIERLKRYPAKRTRTLAIGVQGVYRTDVEKGGNFGALTTHLPAASAANIGCKSVIIGHCEERRDKQEIIEAFESNITRNEVLMEKLANAVDSLINKEVLAALKRNMHVLLCIGETAQQRGTGSLEEVKPNVEKVLKGQLERGLVGVKDYLDSTNIVIAYEPIWAIGPGKTPPDSDYIAFVSSYIKKVTREILGKELAVVYGGGLKEENTKMISEIETIDGGLVALTKFTGDIGFSVEDLRVIIDRYN